jgi:hypothetical protein
MTDGSKTSFDEVSAWLKCLETSTRMRVGHIRYEGDPEEVLVRLAIQDHGRVADSNRAGFLFAVDEIRRLRAEIAALRKEDR